ncbi:MAG: biotin/lipoyl-binding protein [Clostridia bacterium]|nr:biotin/lipoyl-binding protein [Clostridia bacterium]
MGKFKARYVVVPLLVLAIAGGGVSAAVNKSVGDTTAKVVKVSDANEVRTVGSAGSSNDTYYGVLKKGSVQNVTVDMQSEIEEVFVKKGDTVTKGQMLLSYNLSDLQIQLVQVEGGIKSIDNEITIAENELKILKVLQPSENAPQDNDPQIDEETPDMPQMPDMSESLPAADYKYSKRVNSKSVPDGGSGKMEDPYFFNAGEDTTVSDKFLIGLYEKDGKGKYAVFSVCSPEGVPLYSRLVDGNKIDVENVKDWAVSDGVTITPSGEILFDGGSASFASFVLTANPNSSADVGSDGGEFGSMDQAELEAMQQMLQMQELEAAQAQQASVPEKDSSEDDITEKDNYIYSKEELKSMIKEREDSIEKLKLQKSQSELDVKKTKKALEVGGEVSKFDGTVTFVAKDKTHLSDKGAYITVTSTVGMSVSSSIGEFSLSKIQVGGKVNVTNYDDGNVYSGEITSIGDKPLQDDLSGKENSTESMYEFVVTVDKTFDLKEDSTVAITFDTEAKKQTPIVLYNLFVRQEGSRYYVMAVNEKNVIEKRYVDIGVKYFGMLTEITGGLSTDDRIANAYGHTKEGMAVVDSDYNTILFGSMI